MSLRSTRERIYQTIAYELGGLLLATPLFAAVFGSSLDESGLLMVALAVIVTVWAPIHNTLADLIEFRLTGRIASERPHRWRICHALSLEVSSALVTLPVLMGLGGLGLWEALAAEIGLTLFYAGYAYVFHLCYDRLRPVDVRCAGPAQENGSGQTGLTGT